MRTTLYLNNEAYTKEVVLLSLSNLDYLQRQSILLGTTPSQLVNAYITKEKESNKDE
jgi:hypothetical protein